MTRVISFVNLKGGVGKTVSCANTAAILAADYGKRVLVVDADSQCNLTEFFGAAEPGQPLDLAKVLRGQPDDGKLAHSAIRETNVQGVDIIPASDGLMDLDLSTAAKTYTNCLKDLRWRLSLSGNYDAILIDCPPAFNAAAVAALLASDDVIIPIKLDAFSLRGMANLARQISNMRRINNRLHLGGLLPTMWYKSRQIEEAELALHNTGLPVFSHIRRSNPVDDSTFAQRPIIRTSPQSGAAKDYRRFVGELLKGGEQNA